MRIIESADARKNAITKESAWDLVNSFEKIVIGRGKKVLEFYPEKDKKENILNAALGRSGNLRAPAVEIEKVLYVGYNEDMYSHI